MSVKTIANINQSVAEKARSIVEKIRREIETSKVKNLDETGIRINGKTNWLHVVSNIKG